MVFLSQERMHHLYMDDSMCDEILSYHLKNNTLLQLLSFVHDQHIAHMKIG